MHIYIVLNIFLILLIILCQIFLNNYLRIFWLLYVSLVFKMTLSLHRITIGILRKPNPYDWSTTHNSDRIKTLILIKPSKLQSYKKIMLVVFFYFSSVSTHCYQEKKQPQTIDLQQTEIEQSQIQVVLYLFQLIIRISA